MLVPERDTVGDGLIPSLPAALAGWYADPLDRKAGELLRQRGLDRAQQAYRRRESPLAGELQALIGGFALGHTVLAEVDALAGVAAMPAERALVRLIYGQLLISRRVSGAMEALDQGFELARDAFLPADFFAVMKRHELLDELPLFSRERPAQSLNELLREAGVIRCLRGRRRLTPVRHDGSDMTG